MVRARHAEGQGISEYASIIALIAIVVALMFAFSAGGLGAGINGAFSVMC